MVCLKIYVAAGMASPSMLYSQDLIKGFNFSFTRSITQVLIRHFMHDKNLLLAIMVSTTKPQLGVALG